MTSYHSKFRSMTKKIRKAVRNTRSYVEQPSPIFPSQLAVLSNNAEVFHYGQEWVFKDTVILLHLRKHRKYKL